MSVRNVYFIGTIRSDIARVSTSNEDAAVASVRLNPVFEGQLKVTIRFRSYKESWTTITLHSAINKFPSPFAKDIPPIKGGPVEERSPLAIGLTNHLS
tara:strand:- start:1107 stop:1400 length:294 start_codon:yes stop_codon:yes gene_type:complete